MMPLSAFVLWCVQRRVLIGSECGLCVTLQSLLYVHIMLSYTNHFAIVKLALRRKHSDSTRSDFCKF
jgi:hypothetical protein